MNELEHRPERPTPGILAASGFYLLAAIGLCATLLFWPRIGDWLQTTFDDITREWLVLIQSLLYYGIFTFLPITLWMYRREDAGDMLRLNPITFGTLLRTVSSALIGVIVVYCITLLWSAFLQQFGLNVFNDNYVRPANKTELNLSLFSLALIAPVCEELLLRGVMLSAWEKRGAKAAVMTTAVLFAMLHGSVTGMPGEIAAGIVLGWIVLWTDSVYAGMIWHGAYNAAVALLAYVTSGGDGAQHVDLLSTLGGLRGIASLTAGTAFPGWMLVLILKGIKKNAVETKFAPTVMEKTPLKTGEIIAIAAGVTITLVFYGMDLLRMLGGLA